MTTKHPELVEGCDLKVSETETVRVSGITGASTSSAPESNKESMTTKHPELVEGCDLKVSETATVNSKCQKQKQCE